MPEGLGEGNNRLLISAASQLRPIVLPLRKATGQDRFGRWCFPAPLNRTLQGRAP